MAVLARSQKPVVRLPQRLERFFSHFERAYGRKFPWRSRGTSAYRMLVAEVLLRQTRAEDAVEVWRFLVAAYPTPAALAAARLDVLRRVLRPLGLNRQRAIALKRISEAVVREFGGRVPSTLGSLLSIPHVGLYAACALQCFKFGMPTPIVDSNVLRVFGRLTGKDLGRDLRRNKEAWSLAWSILPAKRATAHNYGLLDFAALICKPTAPLCNECPLRRSCWYGRQLPGAGWGLPLLRNADTGLTTLGESLAKPRKRRTLRGTRR
jgi:A/G-specific adenine glycosylase